MNSALIMATVALYVAAAALYIYYFASQSASAEKAGLALLAMSFASQTALLGATYVELGRFPVIDLKESLCFFAWSISAVYLLVRIKNPAGALGVFASPLAALFFVAAMSLPDGNVMPTDDFKTALFPVHILIAFGGHAAMAFAAGSAAMYLLQERGLKAHHPGAFLKRLPSLQELDAINYRSLSVGFFMLSLGIFTGALWLHNVKGSFLTWDPKVVASMVTWFVYSIILHTRLFAGWRGKKTAILSILGFVCVLVTFLGVGLLASGFHKFF